MFWERRKRAPLVRNKRPTTTTTGLQNSWVIKQFQTLSLLVYILWHCGPYYWGGLEVALASLRGPLGSWPLNDTTTSFVHFFILPLLFHFVITLQAIMFINSITLPSLCSSLCHHVHQFHHFTITLLAKWKSELMKLPAKWKSEKSKEVNWWYYVSNIKDVDTQKETLRFWSQRHTI